MIMSDLNRATVVIPAYNEHHHIGEVIYAAQSANPEIVNVGEVIVVNNNSSDSTAEIASSLGAVVLDCKEQGKGQAMEVGAEHAKSLGAKVLTFLDGDLTNLKGEHVTSLSEPVVSSKAPMSVGIIDLWDNWLVSALGNKWPSLSGLRSMRMDLWDELTVKDENGYFVETAMDVHAIKEGWYSQIERVRLEGVGQNDKRKIKEYGFIRGSLKYAKIYARAALDFSLAYAKSKA
jgi:glycosyltransferase involved in cell wall biosynthesis